jgi:hypothetical protein
MGIMELNGAIKKLWDMNDAIKHSVEQGPVLDVRAQ